MIEIKDKGIFKTYRKSKPTEVRILTLADYKAFNGIIETAEGPARFEVGDFLARDAKGVWPIRYIRILNDYEEVGMCEDGWIKYLPRETREAIQMSEPFTAGGDLTGKAGDYIVRRIENGEYHYWPCDREMFESSYELVTEEQKS